MCLNTPSLCRSEGDEGFALSIVCCDNIRRAGVVFFILLVDSIF
jgi:mannitol-1-phosphate/altronate dehydrogenase